MTKIALTIHEKVIFIAFDPWSLGSLKICSFYNSLVVNYHHHRKNYKLSPREDATGTCCNSQFVSYLLLRILKSVNREGRR